MGARAAAPRDPARAPVGPTPGPAPTLPGPGGLAAAWHARGAPHAASDAAGAPPAQWSPGRRGAPRGWRWRGRVRCASGPGDSPPAEAGLTHTRQPSWLGEALWESGGSISLRPAEGKGKAP